MAETAQIADLGQNGHGIDPANAGNGGQQSIVGHF